MPGYTKNLNLIKPYDSNYFNINTWNANMNILDEAFSLSEGKVAEVEAEEDPDDPSKTIYVLPYAGLYFISVTQDTTITFPSYDLIHVVLAFDTTVHNVVWKKSEASASNIIWDNGSEPVWEASKVYEVSILHGHAIAYKRQNMTPNANDE